MEPPLALTRRRRLHVTRRSEMAAGCRRLPAPRGRRRAPDPRGAGAGRGGTRARGPGAARPAHHLRTFSMAAITRLISSFARLRVSARTDRPDMLLGGGGLGGERGARRGRRLGPCVGAPARTMPGLRGARHGCARRLRSAPPARPAGPALRARAGPAGRGGAGAVRGRRVAGSAAGP